MGSTKIATGSQQSSTSTMAPEERALYGQQAEYMKSYQPYAMSMMGNQSNLINQLLTGGQLPGGYQGAQQYLSPEAIGNQASLYARQAMPGFNAQGIADSGETQRAIARGISNDVLMPAQQFNIGALQNYMGLGLGQGAQYQGMQQGNQNALGQRLAGLRSVTGQGTGQQYNPFTGLSLGILGKWGGANAGI